MLTLRGHGGGVLSVAFSPDGTRIFSGSLDSTVNVWHAQRGELLLTLHGHDGPVFSVAVSPTGNRIVSASDDYTVRAWTAGRVDGVVTGKNPMSPSVK